jgi:protoporphyrinogen oxidase
MQKMDYLILGAGPCGLSIAISLLDLGVEPSRLLLLEENSCVGGLCRSELVDNAPLDIGGGHFLDVRNQEVLDFLFRFLPAKEWMTHHRVAKIILRNQEVDHPLEGNLWQLAKSDQIDFLESIAQAGCVRGDPIPPSFEAWIAWKLGHRIAQEYMLPYNRKLWSMELDQLGTYWLYKLPDVSFRDTLRSCLEERPFGSLPAHGTFLYPRRYGYGEVWRRMGAALEDRVITNFPVTDIDLDRHVVNGQFESKTIISTIPWTLWPGIANLPDAIIQCIHALRHVPIDVDYLPENLPTSAHWMYEPREDVSYHRLLIRHNFCSGSRGHWTETNTRRSGAVVHFRHRNEYAYPINTLNKPEAIAKILDWAESKGVIGAGRWGTWEHLNSDVAVADGRKLAKRLVAQN